MKRLFLVLTLILGILLAAFAFWAMQPATEQPASAVEAKYLTAQDRFIMVDGARIRVREEGPEDAPKLILIHGFTSSLETWNIWSASLKENYRVIRYDLLGHGLTGPDEQKRYSPEERADILISLMDELAIEEATIIGNSIGGLIAWKAGLLEPERISQLVLINAAIFDFSGVEDGPSRAPPIVEYALRNPSLAGVKQMATFNYANISDISEARFVELTDLMQREGNGQAYLDHIAEFWMPDPTEALRQLETRTLLLTGSEDKLIPNDHADRAAALIPNAIRAEISGAGHVLQEDAPEESLKPVLAFLAGHTHQ